MSIPKFLPGQQVLIEIPIRPELNGTAYVVGELVDAVQAERELVRQLAMHGYAGRPQIKYDCWFYRVPNAQVELSYKGERIGIYTDIVEESHLRRYYPPTNISCEQFLGQLMTAQPKAAT